MGFDPQHHWETVYVQKTPGEVSWYQSDPSISRALIASAGIGPSSKIIDVGGGASVLVDKLLEEGFQDVTVLDVSAKALDYAKARLGKRAQRVTWIVSDIIKFEPPRFYDVWHDRAVFHFLTESDDRQKYAGVMKRGVNPGGHVIMAAFALEGPPKCSGLPVERYSAQKLTGELGADFQFIKSVDETHLTPGGKEQKFIYCHFQKTNPH